MWALVILSPRRTGPEARAFPGCDFKIQQELAKKVASEVLIQNVVSVFHVGY